LDTFVIQGIYGCTSLQEHSIHLFDGNIFGFNWHRINRIMAYFDIRGKLWNVVQTMIEKLMILIMFECKENLINQEC
jgi:hypothetical protein